MYSKAELLDYISRIGIRPTETLLIHSSMKAIGPVQGGADTVIEAFAEYMRDGLLIFPTHTWRQIGETKPIFDPETEPSCVGLLTNKFLAYPGVVRSWHPTHSIAALGKDAESYVAGEELTTTACPRFGCWGRLVDREAKILFLGCSMQSNTLIHGVEEWCDIPGRLASVAQQLKIKTPSGDLLDCPQFRHQSSYGDVSQTYRKLEEPLTHLGIAHHGKIGNAKSILCDVLPMVVYVTQLLNRDKNLFGKDDPVPREWWTSGS